MAHGHMTRLGIKIAYINLTTAATPLSLAPRSSTSERPYWLRFDSMSSQPPHSGHDDHLDHNPHLKHERVSYPQPPLPPGHDSHPQRDDGRLEYPEAPLGGGQHQQSPFHHGQNEHIEHHGGQDLNARPMQTSDLHSLVTSTSPVPYNTSMATARVPSPYDQNQQFHPQAQPHTQYPIPPHAQYGYQNHLQHGASGLLQHGADGGPRGDRLDSPAPITLREDHTPHESASPKEDKKKTRLSKACDNCSQRKVKVSNTAFNIYALMQRKKLIYSS